MAGKKWEWTRGLSVQLSLSWAYLVESWDRREDPKTKGVTSLPFRDQPENPPAFTYLANTQTHTPLVRGRSWEALRMRCCRYPTRLARAFPAVRLRQGRSLGGARFRRRKCSRYLLTLFAFSGGNNARIPPTGQLLFVVRGLRPQVRTGCGVVPQSSHVWASLEILAKPPNHRGKSPISGPYKSC